MITRKPIETNEKQMCASKNDRLTKLSDLSQIFKIRTSDVVWNHHQSLCGKNLIPCHEIIEQSIALWYTKKMCTVTRKLCVADVLISGLVGTVSMFGVLNLDILINRITIQLRDQPWDDIIRCICAPRGASILEKNTVLNKRFQFQNHLIGFLESIKHSYLVNRVDNQGDVTALIELLNQVITQIKSVDVVEGVEDDEP